MPSAFTWLRIGTRTPVKMKTSLCVPQSSGISLLVEKVRASQGICSMELDSKNIFIPISFTGHLFNMNEHNYKRISGTNYVYNIHRLMFRFYKAYLGNT
jgi:hypothetical protein